LKEKEYIRGPCGQREFRPAAGPVHTRVQHFTKWIKSSLTRLSNQQWISKRQINVSFWSYFRFSVLAQKFPPATLKLPPFPWYSYPAKRIPATYLAYVNLKNLQLDPWTINKERVRPMDFGQKSEHFCRIMVRLRCVLLVLRSCIDVDSFFQNIPAFTPLEFRAKDWSRRSLGSHILFEWL
jgi:hypothetical protein